MTIKKQLAHSSNYTTSTRKLADIKYLVVHYTGNDGDSDEANANYFQGANRGASAHYFVDDDSVTQSVPDENAAWSVGKDYSGGKAAFWGKCTNNNSINVEMCDAKKDGIYKYTPKTYANTVELCKMLMTKFNIPISNVLRHYDVCGKICPGWFVGSADKQADWERFKRDLTVSANSSNEGSKKMDKYNTIDDVPEWGKPTIKKLIDKGVLKGGGSGLDLSYDIVRILVLHDRVGLYD